MRRWSGRLQYPFEYLFRENQVGDVFRMHAGKRVGLRGGFALLAAGGTALILTGCGTPEPKLALKQSTKEYFSEAAYGVKASPRVAFGDQMPRRVGRYQVGDPYKVKGRWYKPKLDADYKKVGAASWYGSAFQGRLTANGEIYDMARLTAAHPTMPLPSYARVTNLDNGSSVIVRVNDRGPFEKGRIIDLSSRAAQLLDYRHMGTAKVEVDYIGPAPLDVHDDQYLVASYHPGGGIPDPSDGLPTGVMVAMNGPTPSTAPSGARLAFASQPGLVMDGLPATGPIIPDRPEIGMTPDTGELSMPLLSYADERVRRASQAFSSIMHSGMTAQDVANSWKRTNVTTQAAVAPVRGYISVGTWHSEKAALGEMRKLGAYGKVAMELSREQGRALYSLNLYPDGRYGLDAMLEAAWQSGAANAFAVHD